MTKRSLGTVALAAVLVCSIVFWVLVAKSSANPQTLNSTQSAAPSATVTYAAQPEEVPLKPVKNQLNDRVVAFETALRSFNWQQPDEQVTLAANYMRPDTHQKLLQKEKQQSFQKERLVASKAVKTVVKVRVASGEIEPDFDLADVSAIVTVRSVQPGSNPIEYSFTSYTSWVKTNGEWYVHEVTPV